MESLKSIAVTFCPGPAGKLCSYLTLQFQILFVYFVLHAYVSLFPLNFFCFKQYD